MIQLSPLHSTHVSGFLWRDKEDQGTRKPHERCMNKWGNTNLTSNKEGGEKILKKVALIQNYILEQNAKQWYGGQ